MAVAVGVPVAGTVEFEDDGNGGRLVGEKECVRLGDETALDETWPSEGR